MGQKGREQYVGRKGSGERETSSIWPTFVGKFALRRWIAPNQGEPYVLLQKYKKLLQYCDTF